MLIVDTGDEFDDKVEGDEEFIDESLAFNDEEFGEVDADGDHGAFDSMFVRLVC